MRIWVGIWGMSMSPRRGVDWPAPRGRDHDLRSRRDAAAPWVVQRKNGRGRHLKAPGPSVPTHRRSSTVGDRERRSSPNFDEKVRATCHCVGGFEPPPHTVTCRRAVSRPRPTKPTRAWARPRKQTSLHAKTDKFRIHEISRTVPSRRSLHPFRGMRCRRAGTSQPIQALQHADRTGKNSSPLLSQIGAQHIW